MNKRVNVEVNGKGLLSGQATRQHKKLYRFIGDEELIALLAAEGATGIAELDWSHGPYSKQWDRRY